MKIGNVKKSTECQKNSQFMTFGLALILFIFTSFPLMVQADQAKNLLNSVTTRGPASYMVEDSYEPTPVQTELWINRAFVDDDGGVLSSMRDKFNGWQNQEIYAKQWNLESTGIYVFPSQKEKQQYFLRNMLRYFDKRLSGEVKKSDSSSFGKVAKAHQTISPTSSMAVSKNTTVKFKFRPLQGRMFFIIQNPFADYETRVSVDGRVLMTLRKNYQSVGVNTSVNYDINKKRWVTLVEKTLTQNIVARLTSDQNKKDMAFSGQSDRTIQLIYTTSF